MENAVFSHLSERLCSAQWRDVLAAFADELAQDLTTQRLRTFMRRAGHQFATIHALPAAASVEELQQAINTLLRGLDWGWVDISESDDHLTLRHFCAPLSAAFGVKHLTWSTGFLEGVYELWMRQLGADTELHVTQPQPADAQVVVYRFGRASA
ncbi:cellulose biosynthesis protein BcsD [Bordetella avium]|uniref:cellulose biosynthesis protein BcsD n=1 Tax=Bordetella avium TaxID=521 RepID=UPI0002EE0E1F|nr:cellulose biosynthesis protein BcsD [Bordetella avium]